MNEQALVEKARPRLRDLRRLEELGLVPRDGQFFPSVHYPPITMYPDDTPERVLRTFTNPDDGKYVVYVHIPFCPHRCVFCHYPVATGASELDQGAYLDLLAREMDLWLEELGLDRIQAQSVLIAGGTPTFLSPQMFARMHDELTRRVDLSGCTQIAYDVHPITLLGREGAERLAVMRDHGSDRLTIGMQSFDDRLLKRMNRGHGEQEAVESIRQCRRAGYDDICIEFIYGYPTQDMPTWIRTLRTAIETGVEEIQLYRLKIVPYGDADGPIEREYRRHPERFPDIEQSLLMKEISRLMLNDAGYHETLRRVFSNNPDYFSHYARDQCCHLRDCVGFGLSAFSSLRDRFSINADSMDRYREMVESGRIPLTRGLVRDHDDQLRWHMVLPLKNMDVLKSAFRDRMQKSPDEVFGPWLEPLRAHGLVAENNERIWLTDLGGFFADEVCVQFHHPRYMPFSAENYNTEGPLYLTREL